MIVADELLLLGDAELVLADQLLPLLLHLICELPSLLWILKLSPQFLVALGAERRCEVVVCVPILLGHGECVFLLMGF